MIASGEAQMNAVERLRHFENNLVREGLKDKELPADQIPDSWPSKGVVQGIDIEMKYRAGPLVLKGISFDVNSCDKVGIVGRTGSGKSSLISALFRIQEIQPGGKIVIDELDISTVPLHLLRSRLGIIPQESVMFSFTVRFNLDPTNQFTDVQLWNVLEELNLKEHISSLKSMEPTHLYPIYRLYTLPLYTLHTPIHPTPPYTPLHTLIYTPLYTLIYTPLFIHPTHPTHPYVPHR
jgi:ABC-type multidrug transport system fused ATPase/permease subunit